MVDPVSIEVATAVAKVLGQWVTSRALAEVSLGRDFKNQFEKLKRKFGYIQAFLDDVSRNSENKAIKSSLVNLWLQNVKDAAYKVDDVMDEYAVEIFRRRIEARCPMEDWFNNFFTPSNHVLFHLSIAYKVKDIHSLLDEVNKEAHDIGLNSVDFASSSSGTHSYHGDRHLSQFEIVNASEYVGRGIHQEKLLDFICCPPDELHVSTVAIVGMGGVGKTTLTRHLYNHKRVRAKFGDNKILICASLKFNVDNILNKMIVSRTSKRLDLRNTDALERELKKELSGEKLFLVLDDVWDDDHYSWKSLKEWLHQIEIARGSVILINTRSDQVLKAARPEFNLKLRGLSKAKSWSLLHQIVVNDSIFSIDENMEEVGKRIVEKCKGVPLAIKAIGGLLQSKQHLHEWVMIEKSDLWDLPCGQNQIFPSLLLSFNSLPSSSVKQCFAYCAILPKGFLVSKIELIGLWLSQGYIRAEIGEENLEILLSNSLLERVSLGQGLVGYKMHDLLYGLAVFVCGSDLIKEMRDPGKIDNCRHLVISSTDDTAMADLPPEMTLPKLRTLGLKGVFITLNKIHATYLRTLFLNQSGIEEVPPAIALLKHLRYLDLSFNPISTLPESMGKLYQLQTLILQGTKIKSLPRVLYTLVNLRPIPSTGLVFELEESQPLTDPSSLSFLSEDEDIDVVANGDDDEDKDENEIAVLEYKSENEELAEYSLECVIDSELVGKSCEGAVNKDVAGKSLECVKDKEIEGKSLEAVEDEEYGVAWRNKVNNSWVDGTGLQQLMNLGEIKGVLHITGLEHVKDKEKARKVGLAGKANVSMLKLVWTKERGETSGGVWDEDVLEALEPHPNITSLEVHNFLGVKFPPWIMEMINWTRFVNLTEVKLLNCIRCRTLPTLGHLSLLRRLFLSGFDVETIGVEFYGYYDSDLSEKLLPNSRGDIVSTVMRTGGWAPEEMSFRSLLELDISGFFRLTAWNEPPQAAFPCLETLRIRDCSLLESVPTLSSKTLTFLQLESLDRVRCLDIIKFNCNLTHLILKGLPNLESLPEELSYCTKFQNLEVSGAHKLSRMPNGLKSLVNLRRMMVFNCKVINFVMDDLLHVRSSLKSFGIYGCPMLIKMPSGLQECTSLSGLFLDDRHLLNEEGLPINISKFQRLSFLGITCSSAEHLRSVLESARGRKVLKYVRIEGFKKED